MTTTINPNQQLSSYLKETAKTVDSHLNTLIPEQNLPQKELIEAARYSLLSGGKRIRPILVIATAKMLGADITHALTPACAMEMIHASSLIHDDLPCMDDDDFRRGNPTVHKKFGESCAVLTGDFLLTYAMEVLTTAPGLDSNQRLNLIQALAKSTGAYGMIGGQILDLQAETKKVSLEELEQIHRLKTGALIAVCLEFGGIIAGATESEQAALQTFGQKIGHAFQIVDDILDVTNSEAKHGHKVASDVTNQKSTYVTLMGLEKSQQEADKLWTEAIDVLHTLPGDKALLSSLATLIVRRNH